jgi:ribose transport system substrate-binding protein
MKKIAVLAVIGLLLAPALFAAPKDVKIEIICMGFQHEYWQTVRMGTEKAAKEIGIVVPF